MEEYQKQLRVIIAGGRDFSDYDLLKFKCDNILLEDYGSFCEDIQIVSGGAKGADKLGEEYAEVNDYDLKVFEADWNRNGKAAGPIRNQKMAEYAAGNVLVAFWDGKSKGTEHMIMVAKKYNMDVNIIRYD